MAAVTLTSGEMSSTIGGARDVTTESPVTVSYETGDEQLMSPLSFTIIGMLMLTYCILGFLFNSCSIMVFVKNKSLRSPTNTFILALNVCDILMATIAAPFSCISIFYHRWVFGRIGCLYEGFAVYFLGLTSMYLLAAISFDRYFIISKPLQASKITHNVAGTAVALCYFGGFFWSACPLVGWNEYALEGAKISCSIVWESSKPGYSSYVFVIFFTCLIIPLCIMCFCYFNVFMTIKSINKNQVWDMKSRIARRNFRIEKKMFRTIIVMCVAFVGAWTPYTVISFYGAFHGAGSVSPLMGSLPALLAKCGGLLNPVIYVATNKQFRTAFYQIVPCDGLKSCLIKREEEPDSDDEADDDETKKDATEVPTGSNKTGGGNKVAPAEVTVEQEGETQIEVITHTPKKKTKKSKSQGTAKTVKTVEAAETTETTTVEKLNSSNTEVHQIQTPEIKVDTVEMAELPKVD